MNFSVSETKIEGLKLITPRVFKDNRGYFFESYKSSSFREIGINDVFIQSNQSFSYKNVIRGLHFQNKESAQAKLVRCLSGEIYDIAVDLRTNSKTFGQYFGVNLSAENRIMFYIPQGFAHGFSVLSESAEVYYNVSGGEYDPKAESGIRFDDPFFKIDWKVKTPIISDKDLILPFFDNSKHYF